MFKPVLCTLVADLGWLVIAVSDGPWTVLGLLITTFGGIALAYLQLRALAASKAAVVIGEAAVAKGKEAIAKVGEVHDEVKVVKDEVQAVKVDTVKSVKMLNGATLAMQKNNADLTAFKAHTTKDPTDIAAAEEALKQYRDHKEMADKMEASP